MNNRNLLKGLFLIAIAIVFGIGATNYSFGRVERAGPGFFPMMVSGIVFLLGLLMVVRSRFMEREKVYFNVKNILIIMGSLAGFALLSQYANMITGIVFLVFTSAFAGTSYSIRRNTMVAIVLVLIAFAFRSGLGLQLPLY